MFGDIKAARKHGQARIGGQRRQGLRQAMHDACGAKRSQPGNKAKPQERVFVGRRLGDGGHRIFRTSMIKEEAMMLGEIPE
jgi:hypothetical protein